MTFNSPFSDEDPDCFAFILVAVITLLLAIKLDTSKMINNIFTTVTLATVAIVVISGLFKGMTKRI